MENLQRDLYEPETEEPCLTDEEKLAQYKLGQLHFGAAVRGSPPRCWWSRSSRPRTCTPPYCMDENKQDMAHSNPYCKISLLPRPEELSADHRSEEDAVSGVGASNFTFEDPLHGGAAAHAGGAGERL